MTVGVISDTHGLLRPEALTALTGSQFIVHAGDVGPERILFALERIAPLTAVRGNTDTEGWARRLPMTAVLEAGGVRIYVVHDIAGLDIDPVAAGVSVVVYGHSHRPAVEHRGDVLFLNPGAAGARRFSLPVTVARLTITGGNAQAEVIEIVPPDEP
ncbi:MAG TPA: metallophosphoesterase family protein [Candidatus Krumholzibacteria bacterium]|nr:metallophosphoesterase family protein [Candidatus Krumholzibacteria bacterium]